MARLQLGWENLGNGNLGNRILGNGILDNRSLGNRNLGDGSLEKHLRRRAFASGLHLPEPPRVASRKQQLSMHLWKRSELILVWLEGA